nr:hypothetical protein [Tanacetum cinerariifolium]
FVDETGEFRLNEGTNDPDIQKSANSSAGVTHQLSSGNTSSLAVGKCTSGGNSFTLTVAKYTSSGNDLEHFIPNKFRFFFARHGHLCHNFCQYQNYCCLPRRKEAESAQQYVLLPLCSTSSKDPHNSDADVAFDVKDNEPQVHVSPSSNDKPKKHDEKAKREAKGKSPIHL